MNNPANPNNGAANAANALYGTGTLNSPATTGGAYGTGAGLLPNGTAANGEMLRGNANQLGAAAANAARNSYRYYQGRWWYPLANNQWLYWNGTEWTPFTAGITANAGIEANGGLATGVTPYTGPYSSGYRGLNGTAGANGSLNANPAPIANPNVNASANANAKAGAIGWYSARRTMAVVQRPNVSAGHSVRTLSPLPSTGEGPGKGKELASRSLDRSPAERKVSFRRHFRFTR